MPLSALRRLAGDRKPVGLLILSDDLVLMRADLAVRPARLRAHLQLYCAYLLSFSTASSKPLASGLILA
jgi:hypothetical protein